MTRIHAKYNPDTRHYILRQGTEKRRISDRRAQEIWQGGNIAGNAKWTVLWTKATPYTDPMLPAKGELKLWQAGSGIQVLVQILDSAYQCGVPRCEIQPVRGAGSVWVNCSKLLTAASTAALP